MFRSIRSHEGFKSIRKYFVNISMKLCFVSVNGARETYFVDEPRNCKMTFSKRKT
jgi:hypothetical protein